MNVLIMNKLFLDIQNIREFLDGMAKLHMR